MKIGELVYSNLIIIKLKESKEFSEFISKSLKRYKNQDWGNTSPYGKKLNDIAVNEQRRILAIYEKNKWEIYITTEWNKKYTKILLGNEFL